MFIKCFKKRKEEKLKQEKEIEKWNKMWELYGDGKIESPYKELMYYQEEIFNGGHAQYFFNLQNKNTIRRHLNQLKIILPKYFYVNLENAYNICILQDESDDTNDIEKLEELLMKSDGFFYDNEEVIENILKDYSMTIE
ncbi:MAG: DUF4375 domain-containing protein [Bacilli bacterium]|nr:DUF4375 domain-containing protein [Bacilli bacterium]